MSELHHANLVISHADPQSFIFGIVKERLGFEPKANPDFLLLESVSFGIDDARSLEVWALGKPLVGEVKVCAIVSESITFEAQNALLKVLEEPPVGTYIFVSLPGLGGLLPTFLSRVRILDFSEGESAPDSAQKKGLKFLDSDINGKLSIVQSLSKKENKAELIELLKSLENIYYQNYSQNPIDKASAEMMEKILTAKIFASSRGSSPKMLMEWLSCVV